MQITEILAEAYHPSMSKWYQALELRRQSVENLDNCSILKGIFEIMIPEQE
jgi:hypothetical protein